MRPAEEKFVGAWGEPPQEILDLNLPRTSPSKMQDFRESPAHYHSFHVLKERERTDAMVLGTAVHMAVLEPDRFAEKYAGPPVLPQGTLCTIEQMKKVCRDNGLPVSGSKGELTERIKFNRVPAVFEDEYVREYLKGKEPLTDKEWLACARIRQEIQKRKKLNFYMANPKGMNEVKGWFIERNTQTLITFRADRVLEFDKPIGQYDGIIIDLKKTRSTNPTRFRRTALVDYHMQIQAAASVDGVRAITGGKRFIFMWLLVNESAPFIPTGATANPSVIEIGRVQYVKDLFTFQECLKTNSWPGYTEDIVDVSMPSWFEEQVEWEENQDGSV